MIYNNFDVNYINQKWLTVNVYNNCISDINYLKNKIYQNYRKRYFKRIYPAKVLNIFFYFLKSSM